MFLFVAYCIILHMDATNAVIDSQAMVEQMVCYITAKPAGDNLESGSAIRHLHISYNASYLPTPPPPQKKKKKNEENLHKHCFPFLLRNEKPWLCKILGANKACKWRYANICNVSSGLRDPAIQYGLHIVANRRLSPQNRFLYRRPKFFSQHRSNLQETSANYQQHEKRFAYESCTTESRVLHEVFCSRERL